MHEISLLFSHYLIKSRNNKVVYLGQNVPYADLMSVYQRHTPQFILTVFTTNPTSDNAEDYIERLSNDFPESTILISGYQVVGHDLRVPDNVIILNKIQDLMDFVEERNG
jgi:hypothetical protein